MPTKKIADLPRFTADLPRFTRCQDPEHDPPSIQVFRPGVYEHECPRCGDKIWFVVQQNFSL